MKITKLVLLSALSLALVACGKEQTASSVVEHFNAASLDLKNVAPIAPDANSPLPKSFKENIQFSLAEVTPKGGQLFVCDTKNNCDAIFAYFDLLKGLAGPYLYQSKDGKVVVQLNSGLKPETASKFEKALSSL